MTRVEHNSQLNQIVIDLGCSLLQFCGEVSAWSPANAADARDTVSQAIKQQQEHRDQIVQLLVDRDYAVDFGVYPADFTDLHFMSLKAFLPRIIANQDAILLELNEAVHTCIDDAPAMTVLNAVLTGERELTAALRAIKI
jgi:hypothetical protein